LSRDLALQANTPMPTSEVESVDFDPLKDQTAIEQDLAISIEELTHTYPAGKAKRAGKAPARASQSTEPQAGATAARRALDAVSFQVQRGEIFGVLGPNGGGKTTLFRVLSTLLRPTSGSARVFGNDVCAKPNQVRQQLGVLFQMPSLDVKLTAYENLLHQGHLYALRGQDLHLRIDQLLTQMNLHDRQHDYAQTFSGGMRRKVELAKALLHNPPLLLLDEPSTGLDPVARRDLWQQLMRLRNEQAMTIVLTTHLMDEADRCDRLAILSQGKLVAVDSPANLKSQIGGDVITIEPATDQGDQLLGLITEKLGPWPDTAAPALVDGKIYIEKPDGPAYLATLAAGFANQIHSMTVGRPTLDDVFVHLTGRSLETQAS